MSDDIAAQEPPDFEELALAFKTAWGEADARGDVGKRTEAGIKAVLELRGWELGVKAPPGSCAEYTPAHLPLGQWLIKRQGAVVEVRRRAGVSPGLWEAIPSTPKPEEATS